MSELARNPEVKVTFKAFNKDFNKAMREMNDRARKLRQEMKLQREQMKHTATDTQKLEARLRGLKREYEIAQQKTRHTSRELQRAKQLWGQNSTAVKQMETALRRAQIAEQQLANRITQTTNQLNRVKAAEQSRTSELTKSSSKLTELKNKHEQLRATMSRMNSEYDLQRAKLGANASETDKLRLKMDHLGKVHRATRMEIRNLENQLTQAKTKYAGNSAEIEKYRAALNRVKTAERELATQITATNAKLREQSNTALRASQSLNTTGSKIQSAGATITGAFAPAAVASGMAFKRMISGSIEFEQATRRAATLTGGEYDKIKNSILDMAKDSVYSTGEVATAFADMGQKGFSAAQATDALPGVLSAAAASGEDLALVGDVITSALNAFGLEAKESTRVADVLAQGANQSAASVDDMGYSFKYAAPMASQLGISIEELAAMTGIMVDSGLQGQQAGTTLRSAFTRLVKPVGDAKEKLKELGVEIEDTSTGKMKPMSEIIGDLSEGMKDMDDTQKAAYLSAIFGQEAVSGMLALMASGPDEIEKMTKALEESEGASEKAADQMLDGWAGALVKAQSAMDVAARTMTDALAPALEKVADLVYWLSVKFSVFPQPVQTAIAGFGAFSTVGLVLLTLLGILANSIGGIVQVFGMLGTKLFSATGSATFFTRTLTMLRTGLSLLTGPIGIVISIITALIAVFVHMYQENESFREKVNEVWDAIKEKIELAVEAISTFIQDVFGNVVEWWKENQDQIREATENVWTWIQDFLSLAFEVILSIFEFVWPFIELIIIDTWESIKGTIEGAITIILGIIDLFSSLFTGDWTGLWEAIKQILSGAVQVLWNLVNLWFIGKILKIGKTFANFFKNIFSTVWNAIKSIFSRSLNVVKNVVSTGFNAVRNITNTIMNGVRNVISTVWNGIRNVISRVVSGIRNVVSKGWNGIRSVTSSVFNRVRSIASSVWNSIKNVISRVVNSIRSTVSRVWNSIKSTTSRVWNGVKTAMTKPVESAKNTIKKTVDTIKNFFSNMKLKIPKIQLPKLPKFTLKGRFSFKPPSVPKIGVKWNAKGGIFKRPTIFNTANAGLQGVGEAGPEAILPLSDRVLGTIGEMISQTMPQPQQEVIVRAGDVIIDGHTVGKVIWEPVKENIERDTRRRGNFRG